MGTGDESSNLPEEAQMEYMKAWGDWHNSLGDEMLDGEGVHPTGWIVTGEDRDMSEGLVADEDSESVGGYYLFEADSAEEVKELMHGCPTFDYGGTIEIRQVMTAEELGMDEYEKMSDSDEMDDDEDEESDDQTISVGNYFFSFPETKSCSTINQCNCTYFIYYFFFMDDQDKDMNESMMDDDSGMSDDSMSDDTMSDDMDDSSMSDDGDDMGDDSSMSDDGDDMSDDVDDMDGDDGMDEGMDEDMEGDMDEDKA